jgi:hypothetical protein
LIIHNFKKITARNALNEQTSLDHAFVEHYHHNSDWTGLVDGTNTENLCGGNNWRVPTAEELDSIVDLSIIKLTIDSDYFPDALKKSLLETH